MVYMHLFIISRSGGLIYNQVLLHAPADIIFKFQYAYSFSSDLTGDLIFVGFIGIRTSSEHERLASFRLYFSRASCHSPKGTTLDCTRRNLSLTLILNFRLPLSSRPGSKSLKPERSSCSVSRAEPALSLS